MPKVTPKATLEADDRYTKLTVESRPRLIAASFGEVGTLKTSFWLSAPGPIVIFSTDKGLEGVVDVYLQTLLEETGRTKDIYCVEYDPTTSGDDAQTRCQETALKFEEDFAHALQHARSVVWDKETQVYEIFKYAHLGGPSDSPQNYYPLDQRYRHLINTAKDTNVNFGLIQGMKTPWVQKVSPRSGKVGVTPDPNARVRRGMREIEELVHLNIEHTWDGEQFGLTIGKCRGPGARDIQYQTLPYMPFYEFAQLVFPATEEEDWL